MSFASSKLFCIGSLTVLIIKKLETYCNLFPDSGNGRQWDPFVDKKIPVPYDKDNGLFLFRRILLKKQGAEKYGFYKITDM
jgi:hypothetical protein